MHAWVKWIASLAFLMITVIPRPAGAYTFGTAWDESFANTTNAYWHGMPTDYPYLADERARGLQVRNVYIRWDQYQTGAGTWDADYLTQKKNEIKHFQAKDFQIILRVNPFPVPQWYLLGNGVRPKNQHAKAWQPDVDVQALYNQMVYLYGESQAEEKLKQLYHVDHKEIDNTQLSPWDPNYQAMVTAYLHRVLTELDADPDIRVEDFWAIYISAGQFGEVAYPGRNPVKRSLRYTGAFMPPSDTSLDGLGMDYARHWNCYWAFDDHAKIDCPVPGFAPATQAGVGERLWNGDFQDTSYPDTVANWSSSRSRFDLGGPAPTVVVDANTASAHSRFLRYTSPGGTQYYLRQEAAVRPNTDYEFSGYIRAQTAGANGWIKVTWASAAGDPVGTPALLSSSQGTWNQVSATVRSDSQASLAFVDVYLEGPGSGTVDFDDLSLLDKVNRTANHDQARAFIDWYYAKLVEVVKWQIQELRGHFSGRLILMGGGDASRPGDLEAEINNDLSGITRNSYWVSRGFAIDRYLKGLKDDPSLNLNNVYFADTGVEAVWNDWEYTDREHGRAWNSSNLQSDWSAPKYYADTIRRLWGATTRLYSENGGYNNLVQMQDAFSNMQTLGYEGLGWYTLGQLFEPAAHANIKDYADLITAYNGLTPKAPTGGDVLPVATGGELDQPRIYDNIVLAKSANLQAYNTDEFGAPLCTIAGYDTRPGSFNTIPPHAGNNYIVAAGKVNAAGSAYCYYWLFNDVLKPYHNITIVPGMKLRYRIYHVDTGDTGNRHVAIDFKATDPDGSNPVYLRNTTVDDQNYVRLHPAARQDATNTWCDIVAELDDPVLYGKVIREINIGFDDPNPPVSTKPRYRAYIDDLRFTDPEPSFAEEFDGAADTRPLGWGEGGSAITLRHDGSGGAQATLLSGTYGSLETPVIVDADLATYDTLEFKINSMTAGAFFEFGLQQLHESNRGYMWDSSGSFNFMNVPGVWRTRLSRISQGADLGAFSAKFWLKETAGNSAVFDYVRLVQHPALPETTPTSDGWRDEFSGGLNETPAGWRDRKAWGEFNAQIEQTGAGQAVIRMGVQTGADTRTSAGYGDVLTPVITGLDITTFPIVEFKVTAMDLDRMDVTINQETGDYQQFGGTSISAPGVYTIDLRTVIPQGTDMSRFSLKFWPNESDGYGSVRLDYVRIRRSVPVHPELNYGSYFGGSGEDRVMGMCLDPQGNIYLVGETRSASGLPFTPGADSTLEGETDAFIAKLAPDGKTVIYCTLLGGNSQDYAQGVKADVNGNAYVTGSTWSSTHFPCTANALSGTLQGGRDAFVAKLDPSGKVVYCSYLGGSAWDYGFCIDSDEADTVYVGGFTHGAFPVTSGAAQSTFGGMGDGFVTKLRWNVYATTTAYSTYLGGQYWESVGSLKVRNRRVYAVTDTQSPNFPVTAKALDKVNTVPYSNGGSDGSFTVLNETGSQFLYSTFFGAEDSPAGTAYYDVEVSSDGNSVYLAGLTSEPHFQKTANALQPELAGGRDAVFVKLSRLADDEYSLAYATFLGGSGEEGASDILLDAAGHAWVSGYTTSPNFPDNTIPTTGCDVFSFYFDGASCSLVDARRYGGAGDDGTAGNYYQKSVAAATLMTGSPTVWLTGFTASSDFPKTSDARQPNYAGVLDAFTMNCDRPEHGTMSVLPTPTPTPVPGQRPTAEVLYASYLGLAGEDKVQDSFTDANGYVYLVGNTTSDNLATVYAYDRTYNGGTDAFVAKFDPSGHLVFCTYLGGSSWDGARGVVADANGIYVTGASWSTNFPTTANALDRSLGGGRDAVVAKLSGDGRQLLYATYLGGALWDYGHCIATDADNTVYVAGFTHGGFPVSTGAAQPNFGGLGDGFITKLAWTASATSMLYSTYAGGSYWESVSDIRVRAGLIYAAGGTQSPNFPTTANALDRVNTVPGANQGGDGFFSILNTTGTQWIYSTLYGAENSPLGSGFNALEVVGNGEVVYLAGNASESGFQTTAGAAQRVYGGGTNDGVLVKLVKTGEQYALGFSTFLGGAGDDLATDVVLDHLANVWVTGTTDSSAFPVNTQALGGRDAFAVYLDPQGQMLWTSRHGGSAQEGDPNYILDVRAALSADGALWFAGPTQSLNFPTTANADQYSNQGGYDSGLVKLARPTVYLPPAPAPEPQAGTFWCEDFTGTAGLQPGAWRDESQDSQFNCEIAYASQFSEAVLTRTADSTWGKVLSPVITCDVDSFPAIELQLSNLDAGTVCKLTLQEEGGAWQSFDLATGLNQTGIYVRDYRTVTGWSGTRSFRIQVVVEGAAGKTVRLGGVRVYHPGTPTADAWLDDLAGTVGQKPAGWKDESDDPGLNVVMRYGPTETQAQLVRTADDVWGKVVSPWISCDATAAPIVEMTVSQVDPGAAWKLAILQSGQQWLLTDSRTTSGTVACDYTQATGWSGAQSFQVMVVVEGGAGKSVAIDRLRVRSADAGPAPTPTPSVPDTYREDFVGTAGLQPAGWQDETNQSAYNAEIAYSATASLAGITRTAQDTWGKVLSPVIRADASLLPVLEIRVATVALDTTWKVGIQEVNGAWRYWDLTSSTSSAGIFAFNYAEVTGWNGQHDFRVQITVEGAAGKSVALDWIRVCGSSMVHAAAVTGKTVQPAASLETPTPTPTSTPEATATVTPTPTAAPWLAPGQVKAYPNPGRDHVNFAYTVSGSVSVVIDVYRLTGERVASFRETREAGAGQTLVTVWNTQDVASGIYIYRMVVKGTDGGTVLSKQSKIAIVK